ncbi:MAG: transcriptional regulator NrdR [Candidatus Micrarchaeia archaeon]|jgi:ribonucleoside-triphosphate reductase
MNCPYCGHLETKVLDSRDAEDAEKTRRRRECENCGKRFTTYERVELVELWVVKKDGRREKFDRVKLLHGFERACEKRPVSHEAIEKAVDDIERELRLKETTDVQSTLIGEKVMDRLRDLDKIAYIRFASVYHEFKDLESFERELDQLKIVGEDEEDGKDSKDSTDLALMVSTATEGMAHKWDRQRIAGALVKEAKLTEAEADEISKAVEKKVATSGIKMISVSLLRELVNNELFVRGLGKKLAKQEIIGMSTYNLEQFIFAKSKDNSNVIANNPEAVNLAIAENTLKQYALKEVYSKDVADAYLSGAIHIHNMGYITRVYCSAHSIDYIKKYGLRLDNLSTISGPAHHAATLTGHLNTFLASMQAYYAGALGLGYVNIFYAPLLVGRSQKEMKQVAQHLIFSCSQNAFSRGGQTLFIDFNVHLGVPDYLAQVPAIGPGGKYLWKHSDGKVEELDEVERDKVGKLVQPKEGRVLTYKDFEKEAQMFARAMFDVWREGDAYGVPFPFPKNDLHVDESVFKDPNQLELLKYACEIASENGNPYFVFDRGAASLSQCCRLRTKLDEGMINRTELLRFCGFQNVTVNLPQAAYKAGTGNVEGTIKEVTKNMDLAMKAHLQKKGFIKKLMDHPGSPCWQIGQTALDGTGPYVDLERSTYIIGMIGLNECVKHLTGGGQLHDSDAAFKMGLKVISAMYLKAQELAKETGLKVVLEETPAEGASLRFAKIDLQRFPEAKNYVRGNQETGEVYYTNSVHLVADAPVSITERIEKQGKFSNLIEAGAITHVFLGEQRPDAEAIFQIVKKSLVNTGAAQLTISPEFTVCNCCHKITPGFRREQAEPAGADAKPAAQAAGA